MKLSSVLDLKLEIRLAYGPSDVRGETGIAVGVAPGPKHHDFRVAVRVRSRTSVPKRVIDGIEKTTLGELDFRETGSVGVHPAETPIPRRPLAIGSSIGHFRSTAGTLGLFVKRLSDGAIGIVSNNHVLAVEDEGAEGDEILWPGPADHGQRPVDVVARLAGDYPKLKTKEPIVDAAFAPLVNGVRYDSLALPPQERLLAETTDAQHAIDTTVEKIGRTTGWTRGKITAFDLDDVDVDYAFGSTRFKGAIEVESVDATPFAKGGDSGSLVFTCERRPLGLVYACSAVGGAFKNGLTYLHPIDSVLKELGVTFPS